VHIGNTWARRDINDEGISPSCNTCAAEGRGGVRASLGHDGAGSHVPYQLPWLVAMPAETQLSILWLILSGAFERLPRSLSCALRRRGSFPYLLGRVDNACAPRCGARGLPAPAVTYVDRFYVDAAVFSNDALAFLVKVMGEDASCSVPTIPSPSGQQVGNLIHSQAALPARPREAPARQRHRLLWPRCRTHCDERRIGTRRSA